MTTQPRCPVCIDHPGWAQPEESGARRDPQDTCRTCFGSGVNQGRTYVVGLPVVVTVNLDGSVEIEVDLSEISDIDEDESADERYLGPQIALDAIAVSEAVATIGNSHSFTINPTA